MASGKSGTRLIAKEMVVLITLEKRETESPANVVIRGISEDSFEMRTQVKLTVGRTSKPGSSEIITGRNIENDSRARHRGDPFLRHAVMGRGRCIRRREHGFQFGALGRRGSTDAGLSKAGLFVGDFQAECPRRFRNGQKTIEGDPRLPLEVKRETTYYKEQSEMMAKFLRILGFSLTLIFSIGAVIGAMITMYAAVANRTGEIGTLRALGFRRRTILTAFLLESLLLGFIGGCGGLFFASFLQFFTVSTTNFQTFSELAFSFSLDVSITFKAMSFALGMGFVGGILPAIRASGMEIVDALREA